MKQVTNIMCKTTVLFCLLCMYNSSFAQPANDECSGAESVFLGGINTTFTADFSAATLSSEPLEICSATGQVDVWFQYQVTSSGRFSVRNLSGISKIVFYRGSCGSLQHHYCGFSSSDKWLNGLVNGEIIYFRAIANEGSNGSFQVWGNSFTIPANDTCTTSITILPSETCQNFTMNLRGAKDSEFGNPSCFDPYKYDVWYDFTSSSSGLVNIENTGSALNSFRYAIYEGDCSSSVESSCDRLDGSEINYLNLTPSTNHLLRIFQSSSSNVPVDAEWCIQGFDYSVDNEDCSSSTTLSVDPENACAGVEMSHFGFATSSGQANPSCYGGANDLVDVWYDFVAPTNGNLLLALDDNATVFSYYYTIYQGTCGSLTEITCGFFTNQVNAHLIEGLNSGQEYFIRLATQEGMDLKPFEICLTQAPDPNSNDQCASAELITIPGSGCSSIISTSTISANPTNPMVAPCSQSGFANSLWYKFVSSASEGVRINWSNLTENITFALYHGSCANPFALQECTNVYKPGPTSTDIVGLQSGEIYYLEIWTEGTSGYLDLCLESIPSIATENYCVTADNIGLLSTSCQSNIQIDFTGNTNSYPATICSDFAQNPNHDKWYQFTMSQTGDLRLSIDEYPGNQYSQKIVLYSGTCNTLSEIDCATVASGLLEVNNLPLGEYYFKAQSSTIQTIGICIYEEPLPASNDLCSNALPILLSGENCNNKITGSNSGASDDSDICNIPSEEVFYSFACTTTGNYAISISNAAEPLNLEVTDSCGGSAITCGVDSLFLSLNQATTYFIAVSTVNTESNTSFELCIKPFDPGAGGIANVGIDISDPIQKLQINGALALGNTNVDFPGSVRFSGSDLEGFVGGQWQSLTNSSAGDDLGNHLATQDLDLNNNRIRNLSTPTSTSDAATKSYVDNHTDNDANSSNELQSLSLSGSNLTLSNGGGTIALPSGGSSEWNDIINKPAGFADNIDNVNDADSNASNEFNTAFTRSGSTIQITDAGGTLGLDLTTIQNIWSLGPNDELYYNDGGVAIGTGLAEAMLDVRGTGQFKRNSVSSTTPQIDLVQTTSGGFSRLKFSNTSTTDHFWLFAAQSDGVNNSNSKFHLFDGGQGGGNRFTVNGDGKIGVNKALGLEDRFTVNSLTGENAFRVQVNGSTKLRVYSNGSIAMGSNPGGTITPNAVYLNNRMGIGTTTPDYQLSVIGRISAANESAETNSMDIGHGGTNAYLNASGIGRMEFRHEDNTYMTLTDAGWLGLGIGSNNPSFPFVVGTDPTNGNGAYVSLDGVWKSTSSRARKENFRILNNQMILSKIAAMDVLEWNYIGSDDIIHFGPMAEDFYEAFGLGDSNKSIGTVDADGVSLSAIKALNENNVALEQRVRKTEKENTQLKMRVEKLELLIKQLTNNPQGSGK